MIIFVYQSNERKKWLDYSLRINPTLTLTKQYYIQCSSLILSAKKDATYHCYILSTKIINYSPIIFIISFWKTSVLLAASEASTPLIEK